MVDDRNDSGQPIERSRSFGRKNSGQRGSRNMIQPDAVPTPRARSLAARNPLVVFGNAIVVILVLAAVVAYVGLRRFDGPGPLTEEKTVYIPRGTGTDGIADTLERQGVIADASAFKTGIWVLHHSNDLKAGEYAFKPRASMVDVMDILVEGKSIQHSLTIPEGLTSQAVVDRLAQDDILTGDAPPVPPEGSILPDTYKFERGTTRAQMVSRMEAEQKALVEQVWKKRASNLPLKSPADLVTLASIVEKETGKADERPHVASVFINRLQKNMRLQSDPTVIYGIAGGKGRLDRPLQSADLGRPTPFNTYLIAGLPPSPIANPGRAAMEAVANPMATKDLYFVADGSGGHAFAETLDQHNKNVSRWRQLQQGSEPAAAPAPAPAAETFGPPIPAKLLGRQTKAKSGKQTPAEAAPAVSVPSTVNSANPPAPSSGQPVQGGTGRKGGFEDPVENTKHDPLLDNTFDLNSPQTVQ
ncbi:UPF0755 protein [Labrys monachus]|uniref:Endolytic murein transglycosylase n=2 Tax=Labrys monachus TaxID=217067 RepID=A0ABU0FHZ7_9HYPH|nr:UPF0755 protein [Labrys monachus]